jgi:6-pyruvoyltetrahydropterin/6-carboxytetrahydropterin synthase
MAKYYSTKTYGNDRGLSCCFRQWRATHSHCSLLHGYSIGVKLTFECDELDERRWVMDFGGLKELKKWLEHMFDHTTLIAKDDPQLPAFSDLHKLGILELRTVEGVGCEMFAKMIYDRMNHILIDLSWRRELLNHSVRIKSVEVFEHGANSAIYEA